VKTTLKSLTVTLTLAALVAGARPLIAGVDVKVNYDKSFDFSKLRTWAWNPQGAGEVKMARTQDDDPELMRQMAEPIVKDAVLTEMNKRGLQQATGDPQLHLTYYLLMSTGASAQTMGQFVAAVPEWGLPPFQGATQSLEVMNQGSLVLDVSANGNVIWRGVASAKIKFSADNKKRESVLRDAVRDLIKRYPAKF
jgi:hypothetical protein